MDILLLLKLETGRPASARMAPAIAKKNPSTI
jgi:hypothetical protein